MSHGMGVVSNYWFDRVSPSIIYMLKPSCWPIFKPPSLGPPSPQTIAHHIPVSANENTPLLGALTMRSSSKKSSPRPDVVLWQLIFPNTCFSGGAVSLFTDIISDMSCHATTCIICSMPYVVHYVIVHMPDMSYIVCHHVLYRVYHMP